MSNSSFVLLLLPFFQAFLVFSMLNSSQDPYKARWTRESSKGWAAGPRGIAITNIAYDVDKMTSALASIQKVVADSLKNANRYSLQYLEMIVCMLKSCIKTFLQMANELGLPTEEEEYN